MSVRFHLWRIGDRGAIPKLWRSRSFGGRERIHPAFYPVGRAICVILFVCDSSASRSGATLLLACALASGAVFRSTGPEGDADGSGTITHEMTTTKAALQQLKSFAALGGGARAPPIPLSSSKRATRRRASAPRHLRVVDAGHHRRWGKAAAAIYRVQT